MALTLAERLEQIRNNPKLQSQQQTGLVLNAVEDTLRDQKAEFTPTAYFSALLALLGQYISSKGVVNKDVATAIVYLLDLVTPDVPSPLLRAKFSQILQKLAIVLTYPDADAPLLRPSIGCLESLLVVQTSQAWALPQSQITPRRAVAGLLGIAIDHRPKVRKRAQDALAKVLQNPPPSPSLDHPAADMCAESALRTLKEGIEATKKQKKSQSGKVAQQATRNLIHTLQLVKTIANASGGWPSRKIDALCEVLLDVSKSSNEFLTMASFEVFEVIFAGMANETSSSKLSHLLEILATLQPSENDSQLMPSWIAVLSRGYDVSAQVLPEDTFQNLPTIFEKVAQFMASMSHNVRVSAADCLISFLVNCVPSSVIAEPSIFDEKTLEKLAKMGTELLNVKFQSSWEDAFRVLTVMFETFNWRSETLLTDIVRIVGQLRTNESFNGKKEADAVLSKAIFAMGPAKVLEILPLNLGHGSSEPGRVWLLPLMRDSVSNTTLSHFRTEMVPLSEKMYERIMAHGDTEKTVEVKIYETIVQQIWSTLQGYCDLPLDLVEAFDQSFAELLANVLYQQVELRTDLCQALRRVVDSNRERRDLPEDTPHLILLRVTKAQAEANLQHLQNFASNILAVLFNVYTETLPDHRGPILQCINAYLSITSEVELVETFSRVVTMLEGALQETNQSIKQAMPKQKGTPMPPLSHTLLDLVITIAKYLPRKSLAQLFGIATTLLQSNDANLQKKAYKIIPRLAESEIGKQALQERTGELHALILGCADKVAPAAKHDRLASISQLVEYLPQTDLYFITSVIPEVVLGTKETNEKARTAAFDLLVSMGKKMQQGGTIIQSKVPHLPNDAPNTTASLEEYLTMLSAGLAGSTPHGISAAITAISRVLHEFRQSLSESTLSELLETMDIFLQSQNREIVRSVLGIMKVSIISLPLSIVKPRLPTLIPNLLKWSHEHKAHLQAKVKHIFERMIRRVGLELVEKLTPESDEKLIANIRKTTQRKKRKRTQTDEADEETQTNGGSNRGQQFENALDDAVYGSDEDTDSGSDVSDDEILGKTRSRRPAGGGTYITEDDEPLDLLDKQSLAKISSTRPLKKPGAPNRRRAKMNLDGKLILGDEDTAMEEDTTAGGANADSSINAYVDAVKGASRGARGKIKFSNKPSRGDDEDEDMEVDGRKLAQELKKARNQGKHKTGPPGKRQPKMKAARQQRRGLGQEKTRGGRVTKGATGRVGRH